MRVRHVLTGQTGTLVESGEPRSRVIWDDPLPDGLPGSQVLTLNLEELRDEDLEVTSVEEGEKRRWALHLKAPHSMQGKIVERLARSQDFEDCVSGLSWSGFSSGQIRQGEGDNRMIVYFTAAPDHADSLGLLLHSHAIFACPAGVVDLDYIITPAEDQTAVWKEGRETVLAVRAVRARMHWPA